MSKRQQAVYLNVLINWIRKCEKYTRLCVYVCGHRSWHWTWLHPANFNWFRIRVYRSCPRGDKELQDIILALCNIGTWLSCSVSANRLWGELQFLLSEYFNCVEFFGIKCCSVQYDILARRWWICFVHRLELFNCTLYFVGVKLACTILCKSEDRMIYVRTNSHLSAFASTLPTRFH